MTPFACSRLVSLVLLLVVVGRAAAADVPPEPPSGQDPVRIADLPPVPNPIGFDARLALRTHLEDVHGLTDCAGLDWAALVERYRAVHAPAPDAAAAQVVDAEAAAARVRHETDQARRANITLQLQRQFAATVDPEASLDDLQRQLDAHLVAARADPGGAERPAAPVTATPPKALPRPTVRHGEPEIGPMVEAPPAAATTPPAAGTPALARGIVAGGRSYTADSQRRMDTLVADGAAAGLTMLVVFETDGCVWCDKLNGYLGPLLRQQKDRLALIRVRVASGESQRFATSKEVLAYPTLFKYVQGRETGRLRGCPADAEALKSWLGLP